jgi:hypothetical protein
MPSKRNGGWIGVDLDGTLARYEGWHDDGGIGEPIPRMVRRVQDWLAAGYEVRIFTARAQAAGYIEGKTRDEIVAQIQDWTELHVGARLPVTCEKDLYMIELWDDRAVQVVPNTGMTIGHDRD